MLERQVWTKITEEESHYVGPVWCLTGRERSKEVKSEWLEVAWEVLRIVEFFSAIVGAFTD